MNRKQHKWLIPAIIYLIGLGIVLRYALLVMEITRDRAVEYHFYQSFIEGGGWQVLHNSIVSSCLTITLIPAIIQQLTGFNELVLFKVYSCMFLPLIPVFIYLISRKYLNKRYSILATVLPFFTLFFLYIEAIGRTGIGFSCLAGMIWAILSKRYILAPLFAFILVFSNYGTAFIALGLVSVVWLYLLVRKKYSIDFKVVTTVLIILAIFVPLWHFGIAQTSGKVVTSLAKESLSLESEVLGPKPIAAYSGFVASTAEEVEEAQKQRTENIESGKRYKNFLRLDSRELTVQAAFGKFLPNMNTLEKLGFALNWLLVAGLSTGSFIAIWKKKLSPVHSILVLLVYSLILTAIFLPSISAYYGTVRVYVMSQIVIATAFIIGMKEVSERVKSKGYIVTLVILTPYILYASGAMHFLLDVLLSYTP